MYLTSNLINKITKTTIVFYIYFLNAAADHFTLSLCVSELNPTDSFVQFVTDPGDKINGKNSLR